MSKSFLFYDLETSGLNTRQDRIMQFAGLRTDLNFKPIAEPFNFLIKLNDDTLPSPQAIIVTGITPQKTNQEGYSEAEFCKILLEEIFLPDSTIIGYNNIRFDDEFIRYLLWRNFYDPYEWSYRDGRSRWDLLDVVRMTRALRPDGINWPVDDKGLATNKLELLAKENKIDHYKAHDAMSDVYALLEVAKLLKQKQPQLFDYLFSIRDKNAVKKIVNLEDKKPFVYISGRFESEFEKATVAFPLTASRNGNIMVYDLRYDPTPFLKMNQKQVASSLFANYDQRQADDFIKLPIKELQYNHAPAVAPLGVLSQNNGWQNISLNEKQIEDNIKKLLSNPSFAEVVRSAVENSPEYAKAVDPEAMLYDGFVPDNDKSKMAAVVASNELQLVDFNPGFTDERLDQLLLHYKARNFPNSLAEGETILWEKWRAEHLRASLPSFMKSLQELASSEDLNEDKTFILQELQLWAEAILPVDD